MALPPKSGPRPATTIASTSGPIDLFVGLTKWGTISVAVILILMAIFLL